MLSRRILVQLEEALGREALKEIGTESGVDVGMLLVEGVQYPFGQFDREDLQQLINLAYLVSHGVGPGSKRKLGCYTCKERKNLRKRAERAQACMQVHPSPPFLLAHTYGHPAVAS